MSNTQVQVIAPYWLPESECWVFDDERHELYREAFVLGASELITDMLEDAGFPNAESGFRMIFSRTAFPGCMRKVVKAADTLPSGWTDYEESDGRGRCSLCPALFHYFDEAPDELYVKAEPLKKVDS